MLLVRRSALALLLVAFAAGVGFGQEKTKGKSKGGDRPGGNAVAQLQRQLDGLDLSDEQKEKIGAVLKEHQPKVEAATKKLNETLTPEQRKARADATVKARAEGKKGRELAQAVSEALKQTEEERTKFDAAQKALQAVVSDMRKAALAVLTPEQQAKLNPARKGKNKA